jgi:taurine dioxygenase
MTRTGTLQVEAVHPLAGARVTGIDLRDPIDPDTARKLREAFARHSVLCVPGQKISPQDQIAFARLFGRVDAGYREQPVGRHKEQPGRGVMLVSNIRKNGKPIGALPDGEMHFHSDGQHREIPYRATTLYAIKVPSRGGDTLFAAMHAAWEALPERMRAKLDGLTARHVFNYNATTREAMRNDGAGAIHPLVRIHPETGRKSLYVSRLMTQRILELEPAESDALLEQLCAHCERPEFVYAHRWTPGDLVIWDNRCLNHARTDFPAEQPRLLRRYTVSEPD